MAVQGARGGAEGAGGHKGRVDERLCQAGPGALVEQQLADTSMLPARHHLPAPRAEVWDHVVPPGSQFQTRVAQCIAIRLPGTTTGAMSAAQAAGTAKMAPAEEVKID